MAEKYDKLVRDDIPDVIEGNGESARTHVATGEEYRERLHAKLDEEVAEFHEDAGVDELADVLEVVHALRTQYDISRDELTRVRERKAENRGRFDEGIVLESVER